MRVDTGQVCRAVAHAGVDLGGRRWPRLGPVRLVPAVTEEDTRTGARGSTELVEEFSEAGDPCEVETGERETSVRSGDGREAEAARVSWIPDRHAPVRSERPMTIRWI